MSLPSEARTPDERREGSTDFIRNIIRDDLAVGRHGGRVATRFPPEPNGYLHIGHAKAVVLNFGVAEEFGGTCNLRFDDTNPSTESLEYAESMQDDVRWLGYDWGDRRYFASDYFERLYELAERLIEDGKAYVDSLSEKEIREYRGTVEQPGRPSPYRDRPAAESLDLFRRMRAGEFPDGAHVLRARIDLAAANMKMRDPLLYRIRQVEHYRRGRDWCIYPMYDWAHPLSDALEGITHSLCTLEFENNRELYDWVVANARVEHRPQQIEFARLNLSYTVLSKRKLGRLVREGHVEGWSDPRMPTLSGLRRRGFTPESIRSFCEAIGVAKGNSTVDVALLEHSVRDDLNTRAPRMLCVLDPLKVVLENYPEGEGEELDAPHWPHDVPREGSRQVPFDRELYIDREDFAEEPPKGFRRLAPGREVRLRYAYFIRCREVVKDPDSGEVVELRCTYDPATRGGAAPDGRKVSGTIHWVSAPRSRPVEVRLYDRLFEVPRPEGGEEEFLTHLNDLSLLIRENARIEPSAAGAEPGSHFQFERHGYFYLEPQTTSPERPVFNRVVPLRDSWERKRRQAEQPAARREEAEQAPDRRPKARDSREEDAAPPPLSPEERRRLEAIEQRWGLSGQTARVLATEPQAAAFFEEAVAVHDSPETVANWVANELMRELKERPREELAISGRHVGELVLLIDEGTISGTIAKQVFERMLDSGASPGEIVEERGLTQLTDPDRLEPIIDEILARHPDEVDAYRGGKTALKGFFVGQVMKETRGRAKPELVHELLEARLHS